MNKTKSNKKKSCRQVSTLESENWMRHATPALFAPVCDFAGSSGNRHRPGLWGRIWAAF